MTIRPRTRSGRRQSIARIAGALLAATALLLLTSCSGDDTTEAIRSYDVVIEAQPDGSLVVEETIDYDFGAEQRHGIQRLIPVRAPYEQTRDRVYPLSDIAVESPSGAPVDVETDTSGGATTIRIGDEDVDVTGRQTYVVSYRVDGVADASRETADSQQVAWNAVGTGWEVPIDQVSVRLAGPAPAEDFRCIVGTDAEFGTDGAEDTDGAEGTDGDTTGCDAASAGDGSGTATATGLQPGQGVTVSATFPAGTFASTAPLLDDTWSPALAFSLTPATALAAGAILVAAILAVLALARRGRDEGAGSRTDGSAYQLTPPQDARPGQLGTLYDERAELQEVTATLVDLAVRGFLRIEETGSDKDAEEPGAAKDADAAHAEDQEAEDWRLVRTSAGRGPLRRYEQALLDGVFTDGDEVLMSTLRDSSAATLSRVQALLHEDVVELGWFRVDPAHVRRRWYAIGGGVLALGVVVTVALAITTTWALVGVAAVLAGVLLLGVAGHMPARTAKGVQTLRSTRAFRDYLASADPSRTPDPTRPSDLRTDGRTDLASRYLPYAMALGVAEQWSDAAARMTDQPAPDWYRPRSPGSAASPTVVWPAIHGFSSSSGQAMSPASSGSGGTSVGVAGGGGGGSW